MRTPGLLLLYFIIWTLCVLPVHAWFWHRPGRPHAAHALKHLPRGGTGILQNSLTWQSGKSLSASAAGWNASTSRKLSIYGRPPSSQIALSQPSFTSSPDTIITSIVPKYQVCDIPGSTTTSCSTVHETITTSACSAVVTGFFTLATISDCNQVITFSTKSSFSLVTTSINPTASTSLKEQEEPSPTAYVQSIVSYFIAPWQSLAADNPSGITVLICIFDVDGNKSCSQVQEVWVVQTSYVSVMSTSSLFISQSFNSPVMLIFGQTQNVTASGNFIFSIDVDYPSTSASETTSISTIGVSNFIVPSAVVETRTSQTQINSTVTTTRRVYSTKSIIVTKTLSRNSTLSLSSTSLLPPTSLLPSPSSSSLVLEPTSTSSAAVSSFLSNDEPTTTLIATRTLTRTTTVYVKNT